MWLWLLKIFFLLLPFSFALNPSASVDLSVVRIITPLIFLLWFVDALQKKHILIDKRPRFWFFLMFLFLSSLSYFWAIEQTRALRKILFLLPFFLLYFPVYAASKKPEYRQSILKYLFWGSFFAALLGFAQFILQFILGLEGAIRIISHTIVPFFQGQNFSKLILQYSSHLVNIQGTTLLRAFGSFPDPHLFSLYLNLVVPIGLLFYFKNKKKYIPNRNFNNHFCKFASFFARSLSFFAIWL